MEDVVVSGIAYDKNEAKIAIRGVPDMPGVAAKIFGALDEKNIVVDMIVQNVSQGRPDRPDLHRGQGGPRQGAGTW